MKKVLTLYSSARPDGNTFKLVQTFDELVPGDVHYLDDMEITQYDYQFRNQGDDFLKVIENMLKVDVIVLASPVYWYSMTPAFRCFFDRLTDLTELPELKSKGKKLKDKSFCLFATSANPEPPASFTSPVENTLEYLGWPFLGTVHVNCRNGFDRAPAVASLQKIIDCKIMVR